MNELHVRQRQREKERRRAREENVIIDFSQQELFNQINVYTLYPLSPSFRA